MRTQWSIVINQPQEAVFASVTDVDFLQQWVAPLLTQEHTLSPASHSRKIPHVHFAPALQQISGGTLGVGTTFKQKAHVLEALLEITEYEPPTSFALTVTSSLLTSYETWVFRQDGDGTRVTLVKEAKLQGGWSIKLLQLILTVISAFMMQPCFAPGKQDIKQYLENHSGKERLTHA
jgi:uncharacterized protein YndB with AHSA1/START domain